MAVQGNGATATIQGARSSAPIIGQLSVCQVHSALFASFPQAALWPELLTVNSHTEMSVEVASVSSDDLDDLNLVLGVQKQSSTVLANTLCEQNFHFTVRCMGLLSEMQDRAQHPL